MRKHFRPVLMAALSFGLLPAAAMAQASSSDSLMSLDRSSLKGEIQNRYNAALALTQDMRVVSVDNNRYTWASQAKAQCGIALGYLKTGIKDAVSVGKCADAAQRMQVAVASTAPAPSPVVVAPPPPPPPGNCAQTLAGIVFFDWNIDVAPPSADTIIDSVAQTALTCHWSSLVVVGHTDRSGSDAYNDALSVRRARNVARLLAAKGVPESILNVSGRGEHENRVPTQDGVRSPENRRVEISVK